MNNRKITEKISKKKIFKSKMKYHISNIIIWILFFPFPKCFLLPSKSLVFVIKNNELKQQKIENKESENQENKKTEKIKKK